MWEQRSPYVIRAPEDVSEKPSYVNNKSVSEQSHNSWAKAHHILFVIWVHLEHYNQQDNKPSMSARYEMHFNIFW